jgi:N-acetylglucosamine kinase-like BadF-type ATPase
MSLFLGMDVGGTHTRAVLVTPRGRVAGCGDAASANHHNVGLGTARARLIEAAAGAWESAGKRMQPAIHAFLGCAGVKSGLDVSEVRALAEAAALAPAGEVTVENDLHNALAGGLSGRPGVALIAGTGTNCLGRDPQGKTFMCGGWGWLLDDEGGAFGLALSAVKAVVRSADGRERATSLLPAALAFFGVSEPNELLARFYVRNWTPAEVAEFAPVVTRHAAEGDTMAKAVLASGARALRELVAGTVRGLDFPKGPEVVLLGGCVRSGPPYQDLVEKEIRAACSHIQLVEPEGSPVAGAVLNALRAGGITPVPAINPGKFTL